MVALIVALGIAGVALAFMGIQTANKPMRTVGFGALVLGTLLTLAHIL